MRDPFRSLKYLPWSALLLSASATLVIAILLEVLLAFAVVASAYQGNTITNAVVGIAVFLLPFGVGAIALLIAARFFTQIPLSANTIWALVGCLLLLLWIKSLFLATVLRMGYLTALAVPVGAFTAGRRYWRRY